MANTQGKSCDVLIIGGGISGAAIAAECAQRGLAVLLCDRGDVGGASSSQSDQILPGALHFLRRHNLPYFNKVIKEKALLQQRAPHLYCERPFVVVPSQQVAHSPISRIWLWLFQHWLQGGKRPTLTKRHASPHQLAPLAAGAHPAWVLVESMVDDARLVIENLLSAASHQASIRTQQTLVHARRTNGLWHSELQGPDGQIPTLTSRCLINATGAQIAEAQEKIEGAESRCWVELKRKLFLVIPKFYQGDQGYLFESDCGQISVSPYHDHFCLVATVTGVEKVAAPSAATESEISDLLRRLNEHLITPLSADSVLRSYIIQQPLYSDACQATADGVEDYALDLNCADGQSPLISVFGGSFATHRAMAQQAAEMLGQYVQLQAAAAPATPLPGGDVNATSFDQFILGIASQFPWLPSHLLNHYCRTYGARARLLLAGSKRLADLGPQLTPGLYQREAEFLVQHEWVRCADDILWRRTRLGLYAEPNDQEQLQKWISEHLPSPSATQAYTMWCNPVSSGQIQ